MRKPTLRDQQQVRYALKRAHLILAAGDNCKLMAVQQVVEAYKLISGATINLESAQLIIDVSQDIESFTCHHCKKYFETSDGFFGMSEGNGAACVKCAEKEMNTKVPEEIDDTAEYMSHSDADSGL